MSSDSGPFTARADPAADAAVRADLARLAAGLAAAVPQLEALVLVGAFGRGEGSMVREGERWRALNDYDLVLVHRAGTAPPDLAVVRPRMAAELGLSHLDVEVLAGDALARLAPSMHAHDLAHGGRVIHGDPGVLARIPPIRADQVDLGAARLLLFNRLTCLLQCVHALDLVREPAPERRLMMVYMAYKVMLAVAASKLARAGAYHVSYRERAARFARCFADRPDEVALVEQATRFKLEPELPVLEPAALWFRVRDAYLAEVRSASEETHGCAFLEWDAFARVHEGSRARDALRKVKWWLMDRRKYVDIGAGQRRADVELAELYLTAAPRPGGAFDATAVDRARARLAPYTTGSLNDWEACRAAAVALDLAYLHPP